MLREILEMLNERLCPKGSELMKAAWHKMKRGEPVYIVDENGNMHEIVTSSMINGLVVVRDSETDTELELDLCDGKEYSLV